MKPIRLIATAALVLTLAGCANLTKHESSDPSEAQARRATPVSGNFTAADAGWPFFGMRYMPGNGTY